MALLAPAFLALGLLAVPIILLYMLRLRRREMIVSSTLLWQKLLRDREANAPWQKLRRNLLLLLQLLILAALVLALARPFIPVPSVVSGSVVVLLDGSASMQANDVEPSRFKVAVTEVDSWIDDLGGDDAMTLILVGQAPDVLVSASSDREELRAALAAATPTAAEGDWAAALALASGAAQGFRDARIVIVSDGGLPSDLPPLPAESVFVPVGAGGNNLALTALATRETEAGPQLFASIANTGGSDQESLVSVTLNGVLFDSRRISVASGATRSLTWELPAETATISARLSEQTDDLLALDDVAWAVHEGGVSNRTLLVTPGNIFLEQVLGVLPGLEAFKAGPDTDLLAEPFDLYVLDSVPLPATLPEGDLLLINPGQVVTQTAGSPLLTVTGVFSNTTLTRLADSPLLQFVDWGSVNIRRAKAVAAPWTQTLIMAEGGALLLVGEQGGRRVAVLTFDLHDSDLPLQIAFPVLMANIVGWLSPGRAFDAPTGLRPGEPVAITPGTSTTAVLITRPDGERWTQTVDEQGSLIFADTNDLGLYEVVLRDAGGDRAAGAFAVNLFAPEESVITPRDTIRVGQAALTGAGSGEDVGQREFWPWLAALAIAILVLEWWVHFRGTRLPRMPAR